MHRDRNDQVNILRNDESRCRTALKKIGDLRSADHDARNREHRLELRQRLQEAVSNVTGAGAPLPYPRRRRRRRGGGDASSALRFPRVADDCPWRNAATWFPDDSAYSSSSASASLNGSRNTKRNDARLSAGGSRRRHIVSSVCSIWWRTPAESDIRVTSGWISSRMNTITSPIDRKSTRLNSSHA